MKRYVVFYIVSSIASSVYLFAGVRDIIGTTTVQYQTVNQVFPKGSSLVQGFVRLNDGLTIAQDASAQLDTFITVSGSMDIRSTGTLDLLSDLYLSSNFTFSTNDFLSGFIKGRGNTIHFSGTTRFQQAKTVKVIDDTIIDGGGCKVILEPYAQLLVDHDVTLTLKNMHFVQQRNTIGRPSLRLASPTSKLALEDVKFSLADDFYFNQGSLFIHGDVVVTGSSVFSYRSAQPCVISSESMWLFDKGTTLFHDPKTLTNDQLFMQDQTASLVFNNATLLTTHTGMRITRGLLCLDNGVTFSSTAQTRFVEMSLLGSSVTDIDYVEFKSVQWSNDGRYAVFAGEDFLSTGRLEVHTFGNAGLTNEAGFSDANFALGNAVAWSPDDRYIVMAGEDAIPQGKIQVYQYDGTVISKVGSLVTDTGFAHINAVTWSVDGHYVIVVGEDASLVTSRYSVYRFDGQALTLITTATDGDFAIMLSVSWSPDNKSVLIGGFGGGSGVLKVYTLMGSALVPLSPVFPAIQFVVVRSCQWSPDGRFVVAGGQDISIFFFGQTEVFSFNGTSLVSLGTSFNDINFTDITSVAWAPDGRRILVGGNGSTFGLLQAYVFNGSSVLPAGSLINETSFFSIASVSWSPDPRFMLIGGQSLTTEGQRAVYRGTYSYDTSPQGFRNSIIFGDASLGASYDLNVEVLGGARVEIDGKVLYDNVL